MEKPKAINRYSFVDGIKVKYLSASNGNDIAMYFLDDLLLLQVEVDLTTFEREVIIKQEVLTREEKDILDRLLQKLGLKPKQEILFNGHSWLV